MLQKALNLATIDKDIADAIAKEELRQEQHIELIASENYTSVAIMEAQGSQLTNKYAEGYPAKRYYGGCEHVDVIEQIAIDRAKILFKADYANVQPHSGSQANAAVYQALLNTGDTVLGMALADGGHLTHGSKVSFSGINYNALQYGLNTKTGEIDYKQVASLANKHKPKMIIAGFSAYSKIVNWQIFRDIADEIGAYLLVDMAHIAGLVAVDEYPSPVNIADVTTTTTHKTLRGPRGGLILAKFNSEIEKKLNSAIFPAIQGGPLMHVIAAKAVAFKEAMSDEYKTYQKQVKVNANTMANVFINRGFEVVSNGTENHLFLVSFIKQGLTGKAVDNALNMANITVNMNAVPNDPHSPFITSGIRIGTPAITTRGFGVDNCIELANWMCDICDDLDNQKTINKIKKKVINICNKYPVYQTKVL